MAQYREKQNDAFAFSTDDWDGYPANRTRLLKRIHDTQVSNPVVVGGDIHSFFANDLRLDFDDQSSPIVATEFVGTSISSYGPPYDLIAQALPDNPHVHFFESRRRGYVCVDLERAHMQVQHARRLRRARPQGRHFDAAHVCGRRRPARRGRGLAALCGFTPTSGGRSYLPPCRVPEESVRR